MSKLISYILMAAAVVCFAGAVIARVGVPRVRLFLSMSQYLDLATLFVLSAILTTLREMLGRGGRAP